jgi:hypothetical protein
LSNDVERTIDKGANGVRYLLAGGRKRPGNGILPKLKKA